MERTRLTRAPILAGQRITLRAARESDMADRLAHPRNAEAVRMYGGDYRDLSPLSEEEVERWYQHHSKTPLSWVVEAESRCIGSARLDLLDEGSRNARYAVGLFDPATWGHGLGTEITRLVLRHAFAVLNLHRVDLVVLEYNLRAIACFKKCGFVQEGVLRESALVAGQWFSDHQMSILEQDYRALAASWGFEETS